MEIGWISNLDRLASEGVLNYDAAADVRGFGPRYVGSPPEIYGVHPFPNGIPQMRQQPGKDNLVPKDQEPFASPSWKKWLLAGVCVATLGLGAHKISRILPGAKKAGSAPLNFLGKCGSKIKDGFITCASKIKGIFVK